MGLSQSATTLFTTFHLHLPSSVLFKHNLSVAFEKELSKEVK